MAAESVKNLVEQGTKRTRGDDRCLSQLARRQHGVVARRQLLARGWSKEEIDWRIRAGRLHPMHAGIYAVGHRLIPKHGWLMAAVLASGPSALLSHRSAAALWGLRGHSEGAVHERAVHEGIPVTSAARTILDLAATESLDAIEAMLREMEFHRRWGPLSLWDLVERHRGKRGVRKVRLALERVREDPEGRTCSKLEERFGPFLRRYRLPMPHFNDWILLGPKRYRVDCHWPGTHQIVELDGWQGHSTRSAFRDDRGRDRHLRVAGYSVTRLTWNQLDDEPEQIADDLRALLNNPVA